MPIHNIRTLLLEDNHFYAEMLDTWLAEADHVRCETYQAISLQDAQIIMEKQQFDVVVADLKLPNGEGLALISRLAAMTDLPILVLTGRSEDHQLTRSLMRHADAVLYKDKISARLIVHFIELLYLRREYERLASAATTEMASPVRSIPRWNRKQKAALWGMLSAGLVAAFWKAVDWVTTWLKGRGK